VVLAAVLLQQPQRRPFHLELQQPHAAPKAPNARVDLDGVPSTYQVKGRLGLLGRWLLLAVL
jgi:hypothetical protein